VNEAPTLGEAYQLLADGASRVLGSVLVTVSERSAEGAVVATAGKAPGGRGTTIDVPVAAGGSRIVLGATFAGELSPEDADEATRLLQTLGRLTSIAERSQREQARQLLDERYLAALFQHLPVPLTVGNARERRLLSANRAFLDLIGYEADELAGLQPPFPWWDPGDRDVQSIEPGAVTHRTYRHKGGRTFPVEMTWHGIPGADGEVELLLGIAADLTEKRRLDMQLVQSGKLAAIGELAAGVAHEINNPLFAILGLTEFLLKEAEPESKARQRLELIQQTGLEIKEIVRALLDFARENAEERLVVPLEDVVRSTVDLVRRTNAHKGVELIDSYDGSGALVHVSPNQIKQVFLNLFANARQAMPQGGTVRVDVRVEGDRAVASVSDDGPGIEPESLGRIFEPFYTTKRATGGTGLGLSVSLGIAESHAGSLTALSAVGKGSTFTLSLPIADEEGE
jgi:PAS domain S-box-containing protein